MSLSEEIQNQLENCRTRLAVIQRLFFDGMVSTVNGQSYMFGTYAKQNLKNIDELINQLEVLKGKFKESIGEENHEHTGP